MGLVQLCGQVGYGAIELRAKRTKALSIKGVTAVQLSIRCPGSGAGVGRSDRPTEAILRSLLPQVDLCFSILQDDEPNHQ